MINKEKEDGDKALQQAIMRTVAFFDLFDFPLSAFEVWKYLGVKRGPGEVREVLRKETESLRFFQNRSDSVSSRHGFYFLSGRGDIVETRMRRYNAADRKFRRAVRVARMFKLLPWVRLVAVGNMMGGNNTKEESDIDLFIVTAPKRIWLARFFCAGLAKALMLRPTRQKKKDKICLSFYVSEDGLDLRGLMLGGGAGTDVYFLYWLACLSPVYDAGGVYDKLIAANGWLRDFFPNWHQAEPTRWREVKPLKSSVYRAIADLWLGGMERAVKKFQLRIMPAALKELMNKDTRVVVSDQVLKLYTRDRREEFRVRYEESLRKLGNCPPASNREASRAGEIGKL